MANVKTEDEKSFIPRPYGVEDASYNQPGSVDHMNTPYDVLSVKSWEMSFSPNSNQLQSLQSKAKSLKNIFFVNISAILNHYWGVKMICLQKDLP